MPFDVLASEQLPFDEAISITSATDENQDNVGWVTLSGLKPNTHYYNAIAIKGEIVDTRSEVDQPWPSFRSLPDDTSFSHEYNPDGLFNFSFSIGACQRQRSPPTPTASTLILRLSIHFGNAIVTNRLPHYQWRLHL